MSKPPIKPVYARPNMETGEWQWGLAPDDFHRVMQGYACGRCLEPFECWTPKCPVCGNELRVEEEAPPEWRK